MSVSISGKLKRVSARALLIDLENGEDAQWIPISQIEDGADDLNEQSIGTTVELEISDWIARQKNIRPVNLERFQVGQTTADATERIVYDSETTINRLMCTCPNAQLANMIAAALNLTQGKV